METLEIEYGKCHCGCGETTPVYTRTRPEVGHVKGKPHKYLEGHDKRKPYLNYETEPMAPATGFCFCGCGEKTSLSKVTNARLGLVKGQPNRWMSGHSQKFHVLHPDAPKDIPEGNLYCYRCDRIKSEDEFADWAKRLTERQPICRLCSKEKRDLLSTKYPGYFAKKVRDSQLKRDYGITTEQYDDMFAQQKGVCAICALPETVAEKGVIRRLSVDHCHENGHVRTLLCQACNNGIGRFRHDPYLMVTGALFMINDHFGKEYPKEQRELLERFLRNRS